MTDDPVYQPLIYQPITMSPTEGLTNETLDKGFVLASFVIQTVVPRDLESVSIDKIIKFRQEHDSERYFFREQVRGLAKDIDKVPPEALKDYLNDRKKVIQHGVEALKDALTSVKIDFVKNLFSLSVPAWAGASAVAPLVAASPVIIPGAVILAASLTLIKWTKDQKKTISSNPYAYLLSLEGLNAEHFLKLLASNKLVL